VNKPYSFKKKTTSFADPQTPYYFVLWSNKATLKMPRRQLQKKFCGQVAQVHGENNKSSRMVNENCDKSGDNSRR